VQNLGPYQDHQIKCDLVAAIGADENDLEPCFYVTVLHEKKKELITSELPERFWDFGLADTLMKKRLDRPINIYLVGPPGIGKSAFANTLLTMLSDENKILNVAVVGSNALHVTTELSYYKIIRASGQFEIARLVDTFGVAPSTYKNFSAFSHMLSGRVPWNWHMDNSNSEPARQLNEEKLVTSTRWRQADVVLFFFPKKDLALIDNNYKPEDNPELETLRKHFHTVTQFGINPIVLIGQADTLVKGHSIRKNPLATHKEVEKARIAVANFFSIPKRLVFPCVSYTEERERNFAIDFLAYKILLRCLENAIEARSNQREEGDELGIPSREETKNQEFTSRSRTPDDDSREGESTSGRSPAKRGQYNKKGDSNK